jgi:hypothetical protein
MKYSWFFPLLFKNCSYLEDCTKTGGRAVVCQPLLNSVTRMLGSMHVCTELNGEQKAFLSG